MSATVADWLGILDGLFPPDLAEAWDNVGLQVGDRSWEAGRALVALEPPPGGVGEASGEGGGRAIGEAVSARLAVFACHTNADAARPGVTDALAEALDLRVTGVLRP